MALFALALAAVLCLNNGLYACPNCADALPDGVTGPNGVETAQLAQGYFWSILFMMAMPFTLLAAVGGGFYLAMKNAARNAPGAPGISAAPSASPATAD